MKKITKKVNIALVCTALLGGVVLPVTSVFNTAIVYAETYVNTSDQPIVVVVYYHGQNLDGTTVNLTERGEFVEFQPGQEIAAPKEFEGYTLTETTYIPPAFSEGILMYVYTQNKPVEQPKDPSQDPSQNDNDNTNGGQMENPKTTEDPSQNGNSNTGGGQTNIPTDNILKNNNQADTDDSDITTNKQDINSKSTNTITQPAPQQSSITENISSDKNQKADIKELPKTNSTKSNIFSFVGVGILGITAFIKRYAKRQSR